MLAYAGRVAIGWYLLLAGILALLVLVMDVLLGGPATTWLSRLRRGR